MYLNDTALVNGTALLAADLPVVNELSCVHDLVYLFLITACVDIVFYVVTCFDHVDRLQRALFAWNVAVLTLVVLTMYTDMGVPLTVGVLVTVLTVVTSFFTLIGSVLYLTFTTSFFGIAMYVYKAYADSFVVNVTGARLTDEQLNVLLVVLVVFVFLLGIVAHAIHFVHVLSSCLLYSIAGFVGFKYLWYLYSASRTDYNVELPERVCCRRLNDCPEWFTLLDAITVIGFLVSRVGFVYATQYATERAYKKKVIQTAIENGEVQKPLLPQKQK